MQVSSQLPNSFSPPSVNYTYKSNPETAVEDPKVHCHCWIQKYTLLDFFVALVQYWKMLIETGSQHGSSEISLTQAMIGSGWPLAGPYIGRLLAPLSSSPEVPPSPPCPSILSISLPASLLETRGPYLPPTGSLFKSHSLAGPCSYAIKRCSTTQGSCRVRKEMLLFNFLSRLHWSSKFKLYFLGQANSRQNQSKW